MFKQYLKPLFIAGCSLLMLAGCGNQTATTTTTTTAPSNPLEGKWEQIDFRSSLERGMGYLDYRSSEEIPRRLIYSDAFKDVTPTLTITGILQYTMLLQRPVWLSATSMTTRRLISYQVSKEPKNNILKISMTV